MTWFIIATGLASGFVLALHLFRGVHLRRRSGTNPHRTPRAPNRREAPPGAMAADAHASLSALKVTTPLDGVLQVGDYSFFLPTASLSGEYLVASTRGEFDGEHMRLPGRVMLCSRARDGGLALNFLTEVPDPTHVHLSDDGLVIVDDSGGPGLRGAVHAFAVDGRRLWLHRFRASTRSGISPDGRLAFIATYDSDYSPHSSKTFAVNPESGELLWTREGSRDVRFDENTLVAELELADGTIESFPFASDGSLPHAYWERVRELNVAQVSTITENRRNPLGLTEIVTA